MFADQETSSAQYRKRFSGVAGEFILAVQTKWIQRMLTVLPEKSTILDVGGGHGQVLDALSSTTLKASILVSAPEAIGLSAGRNCRVIVGDLNAFPLPDRAYDASVCIRFLTHNEKWQETFRELCRISNQFVLVEYPPLWSFNLTYPIMFALKKKYEGDTRTFKLFTDKELLDVAKSQGFEAYKRNAQFFFPIVLHRALKSPKLSKTLEFLPRLIGLTKFFGSPTFLLLRRCDSV